MNIILSFAGIALASIVVYKIFRCKCFYSCEELNRGILSGKDLDEQQYQSAMQEERDFDTVAQD